MGTHSVETQTDNSRITPPKVSKESSWINYQIHSHSDISISSIILETQPIQPLLTNQNPAIIHESLRLNETRTVKITCKKHQQSRVYKCSKPQSADTTGVDWATSGSHPPSSPDLSELAHFHNLNTQHILSMLKVEYLQNETTACFIM